MLFPCSIPVGKSILFEKSPKRVKIVKELVPCHIFTKFSYPKNRGVVCKHSQKQPTKMTQMILSWRMMPELALSIQKNSTFSQNWWSDEVAKDAQREIGKDVCCTTMSRFVRAYSSGTGHWPFASSFLIASSYCFWYTTFSALSTLTRQMTALFHVWNFCNTIILCPPWQQNLKYVFVHLP